MNVENIWYIYFLVVLKRQRCASLCEHLICSSKHTQTTSPPLLWGLSFLRIKSLPKINVNVFRLLAPQTQEHVSILKLSCQISNTQTLNPPSPQWRLWNSLHVAAAGWTCSTHGIRGLSEEKTLETPSIQSTHHLIHIPRLQGPPLFPVLRTCSSPINPDDITRGQSDIKLLTFFFLHLLCMVNNSVGRAVKWLGPRAERRHQIKLIHINGNDLCRAPQVHLAWGPQSPLKY